MRLLTTREAAEILSKEVGRPVEAWMVEYSIKDGRLRAERSPGWRGGYIIPEGEVNRLVEELRQARPREASGEPGADVAGERPTAWDYLPERPLESFWFGDWLGEWRRRRRWRR